MTPGARRGSAVADYLGAVAAVGVMMLALVAVREHQPHRRPPVNPVARIVSVLGLPAAPPRIRISPPAPRRPPVHRPPRAVRPRPTVLAPVWAIGW
jgi:hypothetical protein